MVRKITVDKEKLKIALEILCEDNTSLGKIEKVIKMLPGFDPKTDRIIGEINDIISKINKVSGGEVVELSLEKLPEKTTQQKKRKKLVLLLLTNWKSLGSEVNRINDVLAATSITSAGVKTTKILATLKGPLAVITIGAAVIVVGSKILNGMAAEIKVTNNGCRPIGPFIEKEINLPGLKLPNKAITSGETGDVVFPPISLNVNLSRSMSNISAMGFGRDFQIPSEFKSVEYNGKEILNNSMKINFMKDKKNTLVLNCL